MTAAMKTPRVTSVDPSPPVAMPGSSDQYASSAISTSAAATIGARPSTPAPSESAYAAARATSAGGTSAARPARRSSAPAAPSAATYSSAASSFEIAVHALSATATHAAAERSPSRACRRLCA